MKYVRTKFQLPLISILLAGGPVFADRPLDSGKAEAAHAHLMGKREFLGLDQRHAFKVRNGHEDDLGQSHIRMDQYFQGVRIWGGELIAHVDGKGGHLPMTNALKRDIAIAVTPSLSEAEALALINVELEPKGPYLHPPRVELVIYPEVVDLPKAEAASKKELNAEDLERQILRHSLAYHVHTELDGEAGGPRHTDFLVDAHSGAILKKWDNLHTSGTGYSQYSGTVSLETNSIPGAFELIDPTRGVRGVFGSNATTNMAHGSSGTGSIYTDADNYWGNGLDYYRDGNSGSANGQTAAVDAHFGMTATWNYFQNVHNRNGIDNAGTATYSRVHYSSGYNNAFWDDGCFCMTYGDGDGTTFREFTALDIAGHEMTHGVTNNSARLVYSGESGGLNEATSDIFGTMTEFYTRGGSGSTIGNMGGNWTCAEQVMIGHPLRWMYKPSLSPDLDPYTGKRTLDAYDANWLPQMDVHFSSGPMNRCFYFLSQGASSDSASDFYSTYLPGGMTGIGNDKAARIWYRTLTAYLTSTSNYADARSQAIRAATDLYGARSPEYYAVKNAFAAINVGSPADSQAPVVSSASVSGSSGTITFSVAATDNVGITRVDYWVDSANVVSATSAPFSAAYNSSLLANGNHTLVAKAYDAEGNEGVSPAVGFSVSNTSFQEVEANGSISTANVVPDSATTILGEVVGMADYDYFQINVAPGRTLQVSMDGENAMYLKNAAGTTLASSPQGYSPLVYTNTSGTTATYYIQVKGYWEYYGMNPNSPPGVPIYGPYSISITR